MFLITMALSEFDDYIRERRIEIVITKKIFKTID